MSNSTFSCFYLYELIAKDLFNHMFDEVCWACYFSSLSSSKCNPNTKLLRMQASDPTGTDNVKKVDRCPWNSRTPQMYILSTELHRAACAMSVNRDLLQGL